MAAVYPSSIKSFGAPVVDAEHIVYAAHVNDLRDEVAAVETELGTGLKASTWTGAFAQSASWTSLAARLVNIERGLVTASDVHTQYVKKAGDSMTGALDMGSAKITSLLSGASSTDAVNYGQVILRSGVNAMQADLNMGTSYKITNLAAGSASTDAVNKSQLDLKVTKAGDTMTGSLSMGGTYKVTGLAPPTVNGDAARYDELVSLQDPINTLLANALLKSGGTMSGNINMGGHYVLNIGMSGAANDAATVGQVNARLPLSGGTMSGAIAMGNNKVTGLAKGTASGEAMARQQVQAGRLASGAIYETGGMTITFAIAFGATPNVVCQFEEGSYFANVHTVGTSSFKLTIHNFAGQLPNYSSAPGFQWIAVGD